MFESFVWMFKNADFKKHFWYLFVCSVILLVLGIIANILFHPYGLVFVLIAALLISGYFWNLASQVIDRDSDIVGASVYNGKIKQIYTVELPSLSFFATVWRGFASIVASVLLLIPYAFIVHAAYQAETLGELPQGFWMGAYAFYCLFFPALLWNYAKNNSVVSVWNIRKAVFIMGNYTFKYIVNVFVMIIVCIIGSIIEAVLFMELSLLVPLQKITLVNGMDIWQTLIVAVFLLILTIKNIYLVFVNAYLLGTISPAGEC